MGLRQWELDCKINSLTKKGIREDLTPEEYAAYQHAIADRSLLLRRQLRKRRSQLRRR